MDGWGKSVEFGFLQSILDVPISFSISCIVYSCLSPEAVFDDGARFCMKAGENFVYWNGYRNLPLSLKGSP